MTDKTAIAFDLISPFHIASALAAIGKDDNVTSAVLYILPNLQGKYVLEPQEFKFKGITVRIEIQPSIKGSKILNLIRFFIFWIMWLTLGRFLQKRHYILHHTYFKVTCFQFLSLKEALRMEYGAFEEGIGTYGDLKHHIAVAKRENKKFPILLNSLKSILKRLVNYNFRVLKNPDRKDLEAFYEAIGSLTINVYQKDVEIELSQLNSKSQMNSGVIFFSAPFIDLLNVSLKDFDDLLKSISMQYPPGSIYIKPHPLEIKSIPIYESHGFKVLSNKLPAEIVLYMLKPKKIIGAFSTSLLVAKHVFNIEIENLNLSSLEDESVKPTMAVESLFNGFKNEN